MVMDIAVTSVLSSFPSIGMIYIVCAVFDIILFGKVLLVVWIALNPTSLVLENDYPLSVAQGVRSI